MRYRRLDVPVNQDMEVWFSFIGDSLTNSEAVEELEINFNKISFLHTDDFVVLACLIEVFYIKGSKISFSGGTAKFNNHLNNIKFKKYWEPGFDRERFTISLNRSTLCLWKISKSMIYTYSDYAKQYFRSTFMTDKDLLPLATNLDEVFNNIFDHSQSEISGYIITQYFPKIHKLSFSVCDFGVGIANSINDYLQKSGSKKVDDWQALLYSLQLGYSVKSTPRNRGFGLNNILELTESSNGILTIISNNGLLIKKSDSNYEVGNTGNTFSGTLIKVEVDTRTFDNIDEGNDIYDF